MNISIKSFLLAVAAIGFCHVAKAQYSFTVENLSGVQGSTIDVPVCLNNGEIDVTAFNCNLFLPEGVTVEKDDDDEYVATLSSSRSNKHTIESALQKDNSIRFVAYSAKNNTLKGSSGDVIFTTSIVLDAEPGEYTISIKNADITEAGTFNEFSCEETTATLTILPQEINLAHGEAYTGSEKKENVTVNYTRTFSHTNWQALYVPFAMKYDEWMDLGEVATLTGVSGTADEPVLEWTIVESGEISASTPYIFKPKTATEVTFKAKGTTLEAASATANTVSKTHTSGATFSLSGTYTEKTDMADEKAYGMTNGVFRPTNKNSHTLKPYLIYLVITTPTSMPAAIRSSVNGSATSIEGILTDEAIMVKSFDLMGREVRDQKGGIVIKNGQKTFVNQ